MPGRGLQAHVDMEKNQARSINYDFIESVLFERLGNVNCCRQTRVLTGYKERYGFRAFKQPYQYRDEETWNVYWPYARAGRYKLYSTLSFSVTVSGRRRVSFRTGNDSDYDIYEDYGGTSSWTLRYNLNGSVVASDVSFESPGWDFNGMVDRSPLGSSNATSSWFSLPSTLDPDFVNVNLGGPPGTTASFSSTETTIDFSYYVPPGEGGHGLGWENLTLNLTLSGEEEASEQQFAQTLAEMTPQSLLNQIEDGDIRYAFYNSPIVPFPPEWVGYGRIYRYYPTMFSQEAINRRVFLESNPYFVWGRDFPNYGAIDALRESPSPDNFVFIYNDYCLAWPGEYSPIWLANGPAPEQWPGPQLLSYTKTLWPDGCAPSGVNTNQCFGCPEAGERWGSTDPFTSEDGSLSSTAFAVRTLVRQFTRTMSQENDASMCETRHSRSRTNTFFAWPYPEESPTGFAQTLVESYECSSRNGNEDGYIDLIPKVATVTETLLDYDYSIYLKSKSSPSYDTDQPCCQSYNPLP